MKYFNYKPTALVNKLLGQNIQDLRKSLDEIKQYQIKLNKVERNSTNNKKENDRDLIRYQVLLTELINFLSINFCRENNQHN